MALRKPQSAGTHCLPGLTASQSQRVRSLMRTALAERGLEAAVYADHLVTADGRQFGLTTLGSLCRRSGGDAGWPAVVNRYLDDLLTNFPQEPQPLTPHQIRDGVHLRLAQLDAEKVDWYTYARSLGAGFHELLVHKDGDFVRWIHDKELSGVDVEKMHALGRQRLLDIRPDEVQVVTGKGAGVFCVRGESGFIASKVLVLPELLAILGDRRTHWPEGVIVAVPSRHELVIAPVSDAIDSNLDAIQVLTAYDHSHDHAPISPIVHWWHEGHLHPLFDAAVPGRHFFADVPEAFFEAWERNGCEGVA